MHLVSLSFIKTLRWTRLCIQHYAVEVGGQDQDQDQDHDVQVQDQDCTRWTQDHITHINGTVLINMYRLVNRRNKI